MRASGTFRQLSRISGAYWSLPVKRPRSLYQTSRIASSPPSQIPFRCSNYRAFASEASSTPPALRSESERESQPSESSSSPPAPRAAWRPAPHRDPNEPVYELYVTCKVCKERSGHTISKQGFHKGTVLVQCPGCQNRHLIADHLKIFSDKSVTVEQLLAARGEAVQRGLADPTSDMEFWAEAAMRGKMPKGDEEK